MTSCLFSKRWYCSILDEHAPIKQVQVRGNQVPYMNDEWRRAIRRRNHFWNIFSRIRSDANYAAYKKQRNLCTSLRRKAIKGYFTKRSEEISQDPRNFWNTFRPFLHRRKSFKANDIILKENECIMTGKSEIANVFNDYFRNIAGHIDSPSEVDYGAGFQNHPSVLAIRCNIREL